MRRATAALLSLSLALLSPGQAWVHAANIVAKPVTVRTQPGGVPVGGGGAAAGTRIPRVGPSATGIGRFGVLPGLQSRPTIAPGAARSAQAAAAALAAPNLGLPVSPALLRQAGLPDPAAEAGRALPYNTPRAQSPSLMPGLAPQRIAESGLAPGLKQAPAPGRAFHQKPIFGALSLPSAFEKGRALDPESARGAAEADFDLHTGRRRREPPASTPLSYQESPPFPVGAGGAGGRGVSFSRAQTQIVRFTPGLRSGTLRLATPFGPAKELRIRSVIPGDTGARPLPPASYAPDALPLPRGERGSPENAAVSTPRARRGVEYRSAYFPVQLLALSAAALGLAVGLPVLAQTLWPAVAPLGVQEAAAPVFATATAILKGVAWGLGAATGVSMLYALWDLGVYTWNVAFGRPASDDEFWNFTRKELARWDLHPSVRSALLGTGPGKGLLRIWRPSGRFAKLAYGFTAGGVIYLRPELVRAPWLFSWVLKHELAHLENHIARGPPSEASGPRGFIGSLVSELGARARELRSQQTLGSVRLPILSRVLHDAKLSLRLHNPYEVLIVNPGTHETRNPSRYEELSGRKAKVVTVPEGENLAGFLGRPENAARFRLAVYPRAFDALPQRDSPEGRRLRVALRRLDELYRLSARLPVLERSGLQSEAVLLGRVERLSRELGIDWRRGMDVKSLGDLIEDMYFRLSRDQLGRLGIVGELEKLYAGLHHRGAVLLPFAADEPGLDTIERLLRYWQAPDAGGFSVRRVDLPEGGHILVARKAEPRVDLWLRPAEGRRVERSITNLQNKEGGPGQDALLRSLGFGDEDLARFRDAGLEVRHTFGADVGENRIYVNVKRSHARLLRRYAEESGFQFATSRGGYRMHLIQSAPIHGAPATWKLSIRGEGMRIYDIDTGLDVSHPDFADRILESIDFVDEGPEDWIGHGTHKAGISYANGTVYRGLAPKALGRMGKVFSQNGLGASDGDIMAAAVDAMQWGADVISLSLGSRGTVDAPLAVFFSNLTRQKNARGHYPIVTGSAGNSGPFNSSKSQPSVGEFVASVAAAAKSLVDGVREIAFFSSVGPTLDNRYTMKRFRWPFGGTLIGGDVTTPADMGERPPEKRDVYEHGVESTKSKDMPPSPSDTPDGKHTRMSGTSMSNPMYAAAAALVKQAALRAAKAGTAAHAFFMDELPLAVNLILMRSAEDMRVPVHFQEAGFVSAERAVRLASESFGGDLLSWPRRLARALARFLGFARSAAQPEAVPWAWIQRIKAIHELETAVFEGAEKAKREAEAKARETAPPASGNPEAPREDPRAAQSFKQKIGQAGNAALNEAFNKLRVEATPELLKSLAYGDDGAPAEPVWLVRMLAAWALLNLKTPEAVGPLARAALADPDGRVRQAAYLAIAETHSYAADEALRSVLRARRPAGLGIEFTIEELMAALQARLRGAPPAGSEAARRAADRVAADAEPEAPLYAAFALARHGKLDGVELLRAYTLHPDKKARFTAVWLLGQLGQRAPPGAADALASRAKDERERGNINHLAVASLTEIALSAPAALTNETLLDLLAASGPQNFALTRTISKFFSAAARSPEVQVRMREKPLRDDIAAFVHKHKASIHRPGALGEMVRLFAKILDVPLDVPTPLPDPRGAGVAGVDPNLGPVHMIVELPPVEEGGPALARFEDFRGRPAAEGGAAVQALGLDAGAVAGHEAALQAAMPNSRTLWFTVPDHKVTAFGAELEAKGWRARRAGPMYRLLHETGPLTGKPQVREKHGGLTGKNVLVVYLDEGGDTEHPAIARERILHKRNFTDEGGPTDVEREGVSHGTHGMGIVGARSVDGSPYEGMAPGVDFAIGKVLGETGGSEATVMAGLEWAAALVSDPLKTPVIVNLSLGGPGRPDSALGRLVTRLALRNIRVVAAAGNEGPMDGTVGSPANAPLATPIGALGKDGTLQEYSSRKRKSEERPMPRRVHYGGSLFFDRPNMYEIISTLSTRLADIFQREKVATGVEWKGRMLYHTMSGTSMAAPHETGDEALLAERALALFPQGLPDGFWFWADEKLLDPTAAPVPGAPAHAVGFGRTDIGAALAELEKRAADPAAARAEAEALKKQLAERYGRAAEPGPEPTGWLRRAERALPATVSSILAFALGLLFLPV